MTLYTKFIDEKIAYTGRELSEHWISGRTGIFGSAVVAFRGLCMVETDDLVDLEDRRKRERIEAREMLHFLGEWFDGDLMLGIWRQRLLIASFAEELRKELRPEARLIRDGNDLFLMSTRDESRSKLSVSIVTSTPVSTLFHFGVNVDATGSPVAAIGLAELGVDTTRLARNVLQSWQKEWESIGRARCKVTAR